MNSPTRRTGSTQSAAVVQEVAKEPACGFNRPESGGVLCNAAVSICPAEEETAYWVFRRTRNTRTGAVTAWVRDMDPPFQCLAADEEIAAPAVPVEVLIAAQLARDFASLPLPRAQVTVQPRGDTLVNVETRFSTGTGTQALPPRTVLGRQVTVTAVSERYDWHMGDGTVYPDTGPGSVEAPVRHRYRSPATASAFVRVTWSGTFTMAGDPRTFDIEGTATTDGPAVLVPVREARAQLVDG